MPGLRRQRHNVKPTAITIGCVVEALVINKQGEEAWQLVQDGVKVALSNGYLKLSSVRNSPAGMFSIGLAYAGIESIKS
jgi:hypothetical protein